MTIMLSTISLVATMLGLVITLRLLRAVLGWVHRRVGSHSSRSRLEDEENSMGEATADRYVERTAVTVPCARTSAYDVTMASQSMLTAPENLPAGGDAGVTTEEVSHHVTVSVIRA